MKNRTSKEDKAATEAVCAYVVRWMRLGLRATYPDLATISHVRDIGTGVVHIDAHGNSINGTDIRMRDAIAFFSSHEAARTGMIEAQRRHYPSLAA